jgi:hypothetical protein
MTCATPGDNAVEQPARIIVGADPPDRAASIYRRSFTDTPVFEPDDLPRAAILNPVSERLAADPDGWAFNITTADEWIDDEWAAWWLVEIQFGHERWRYIQCAGDPVVLTAHRSGKAACEYALDDGQVVTPLPAFLVEEAPALRKLRTGRPKGSGLLTDPDEVQEAYWTLRDECGRRPRQTDLAAALAVSLSCVQHFLGHYSWPPPRLGTPWIRLR